MHIQSFFWKSFRGVAWARAKFHILYPKQFLYMNWKPCQVVSTGLKGGYLKLVPLWFCEGLSLTNLLQTFGRSNQNPKALSLLGNEILVFGVQRESDILHEFPNHQSQHWLGEGSAIELWVVDPIEQGSVGLLFQIPSGHNLPSHSNLLKVQSLQKEFRHWKSQRVPTVFLMGSFALPPWFSLYILRKDSHYS